MKSIPPENRCVHGHYSSLYAPETKMVVEERFERVVIESFGYEFKNVEPALDQAHTGRPKYARRTDSPVALPTASAAPGPLAQDPPQDEPGFQQIPPPDVARIAEQAIDPLEE